MANRFYVRKLTESDLYVPGFSLVRIIGLVKIVHDRNEHLERHKLWKCMKEKAFSPWMYQVVNNVA